MIEEQYVSFETAKLLKEKGFDEECIANYIVDVSIPHKASINVYGLKHNNTDYLTYSDIRFICAPTQQMTLRWLREMHNIPINVLYSRIYVHHYKFTCVTKKHEIGDAHRYDTYEQACEAAILYCLKNLIKRRTEL